MNILILHNFKILHNLHILSSDKGSNMQRNTVVFGTKFEFIYNGHPYNLCFLNFELVNFSQTKNFVCGLKTLSACRLVVLIKTTSVTQPT